MAGMHGCTKSTDIERASWEEKPAWTCEEGESYRPSTPAFVHLTGRFVSVSGQREARTSFGELSAASEDLQFI